MKNETIRYCVFLEVDDEGFGESFLEPQGTPEWLMLIAGPALLLGTVTTDNYKDAESFRDEMVDRYHTRQAALRG